MAIDPNAAHSPDRRRTASSSAAGSAGESPPRFGAAAVTGITPQDKLHCQSCRVGGPDVLPHLGWFGSVYAVLLGRRYGFAFVQPLLLSGVVYSVGGAREFHDRPAVIPRVVHAHEVFHLSVLGGAFLHWM